MSLLSSYPGAGLGVPLFRIAIAFAPFVFCTILVRVDRFGRHPSSWGLYSHIKAAAVISNSRNRGFAILCFMEVVMRFHLAAMAAAALTVFVCSCGTVGDLVDGSGGSSASAAAEKAVAKKTGTLQEPLGAYADRMTQTIQYYIDKGYFVEAKFLLDDLKKANVPSDKKSAVDQLDAKLASAFAADKEDSRYNSALLTPAKDSNGKYGYIDQSGAFVIEAKYEKAGEFSEGLALVSNGDKYQYIDAAGKTALVVEVRPEMFFFDPAKKTVGARGSLIPYEGDLAALPPSLRLQPLGGFHNGLAHWKLNQYGSVKDAKGNYVRGRQGAMYVDKSGKEAFFLYSNDISDVTEANGMSIYHVEDNADFHDGAVVVGNGSSMFYIDKSGHPITEPDFRIARAFSDGMACVNYNNSDLWGYLAPTGKVAIKPFYNGNSVDFSDDVCVLLYDPKATFKEGCVFDKDGKILYEFKDNSAGNQHLDFYDAFSACGDLMIPTVRETGAYPHSVTSIEILDKAGKPILSLAELKENWQYAKVLPFSNGRAFVNVGVSNWGVIDTRGQFIVQPSMTWEPVGSGYRNGLATIKTSGGRRAYMDRDGKVVFVE